jgi:hypothetical protein
MEYVSVCTHRRDEFGTPTDSSLLAQGDDSCAERLERVEVETR